MKRSLIDNRITTLAVPPQFILAFRRARLFENDADGIREPHRVVRGVGRQKEHFAFADGDVPKGAIVLDYLQQHRAAVLVKPFGRFVDVVVGSSVGAPHDLFR